ncbi:transcription antitermination factor NusB [Planctomycetota bacterium]
MTARQVALAALLALERSGDNRFLKEILGDPESGYQELTSRDRSLCRELAYGSVRHRRTLRHLLASRSHAPRSRQDRRTRNALLLGAYQLLFLSGIKTHAAVSETVSLVPGKKRRGFLNAVLRAVVRLRGEILEKPPQDIPSARLLPLREGRLLSLNEPVLPDWHDADPQSLGITFSYPDVLVNRWLKTYGTQKTLGILAAANEVPPICLRVHESRVAAEEVVARLRTAGYAPSAVPGLAQALLLPAGVSPERLPGFQEGLMSVQDATAQEVAELLGAAPGERLLDLCAAPGGKALVMGEAVGASGMVCCRDLTASRLQLVREAFSRVKLEARLELVPGDVLAERFGADGGGEASYDRVLVDVPCSNTGVLRRRVEARWRAAGLDLNALAQKQLALLSAGAQVVKPQGVLVYSTCSIEEEENRGVVMAFIAANPQFELLQELGRRRLWCGLAQGVTSSPSLILSLSKDQPDPGTQPAPLPLATRDVADGRERATGNRAQDPVC